MPVLLPVTRLSEICNPFLEEIWGSCVTEDAVREALLQKHFVDTPDTGEDTFDHAGRIAFFVENESCDPIDIDVGVPVIGFYLEWIVVDGNHRFAAAIFAKRESILANVQGQLNYANELLGVDCEDHTYAVSGAPR